MKFTTDPILAAVIVSIVLVIAISWLIYEVVINNKFVTVRYKNDGVTSTVNLKNNEDFKNLESYCKRIEKRVDKLEKTADEILTDIRGIKVRLNSKGL